MCLCDNKPHVNKISLKPQKANKASIKIMKTNLKLVSDQSSKGATKL